MAKLDGCTKRIDEHTYKVKSQSEKGENDVISTELGFTCSCPDHVFRGVKCKHIIAVEISFALRKNLEESHTVIQAINIQNCPRCHSDKIIKRGIRRNKSQYIQRYYCNGCSRWFVINFG